MISVSIIIPTFNGAHKISRVLHALKVQSFQDFEIIVVIDGSTDNTLEVLKNYESKFSNFKIVLQENKGRASVRNRGVNEASGDLMIFFDDDMLPLKDCVGNHTKHHEKFPDCILTGGLEDRAEGENNDFQQFKNFLSRKWTIPLNSYNEVPLPKENIFITAANFSISKKKFLQLGGFDQLLTDGEDFDLAFRANNLNVPIYYDHDAFAWHNDPVTGKSYIKRLREYRKAGQQLRVIRHNLNSQFPARKPIMPSGLKWLIFLFFTNRFWVSWLDKRTLKMLIPQFLRYKLYDLIITANGVYFPGKVKL